MPGYLGYRGKEGYWGFWDAVIPILTAEGFRCVPVPTEPIGSIERRSAKLCDTIRETTRDGDALDPTDRLYLLGFSTGGLDVRYLLSPATPLTLPAAVRSRVRAAVTLATPNHGTPMADFYRAWRADDLFGFFAGIFAKWSTSDRIAELGRLADKHRAVIQRVLGEPQREEFLRFVEGLLIATKEERESIQGFLDSIARSRGALEQLRVRSMRVFNERVTDDPGLRYVSFIAGTEPIPPSNFGTALFALGWFITTRRKPALPPPPDDGRVPPPKVCSLDGSPLPPDASPVVISAKLSDAVVPTISQYWGELGGYAPVDHHAACGKPHHMMRVPEFAGEGVRALYGRIANALRGNDG
ncbi:hypothetical protein FJZ36_08285 [Candidatus Poribacteria bacterium]|nr:hypothetical protein [Candidatus Poribacteria bacterium]